MTSASPERQLRALILAPRGRDAAVAQSLIELAGVGSAPCHDLPELVETLDDDVAFILMTEEAIRTADLKPLSLWLAGQPAWSDLPFVLVTDHGGGPERNPIAGRWLEALGNVSFIERPFHPTTLLSIARATVKGRRRQYETRALLEDLRQSELRLQQVNDRLERRVDERTAQLQHAHDALVSQIAERERTEEQLRHMQKLESIGQLTGGVAHDFNNLLTAVLGNLELLRKRLPPDPSIERLIDGATQGARRGASLTQRLLAFARRQALEPKPTDLAELVRGMSDLLRRSIGPAVAINLDLPGGLPPASADANQIELALLNLAVNGRDAMPNGGTLTIALACQELPETRDLAAGRYVRLSVSDTGRGMDPETLKRAIEPFFSTKEIGKGTGLGLSMIHGLALQLKGALRLSSDLDHGTRAELWLPVARARRGARRQRATRHAAVRRRRFPDQPQHRRLAGRSRSHGDQGAVGCGCTRCAEERQAGRPHDHRLRHARHDRPATRRGGATAAPGPADPAGDGLCRPADAPQLRPAAPFQALSAEAARRADHLSARLTLR